MALILLNSLSFLNHPSILIILTKQVNITNVKFILIDIDLPHRKEQCKTNINYYFIGTSGLED